MEQNSIYMVITKYRKDRECEQIDLVCSTYSESLKVLDEQIEKNCKAIFGDKKPQEFSKFVRTDNYFYAKAGNTILSIIIERREYYKMEEEEIIYLIVNEFEDVADLQNEMSIFPCKTLERAKIIFNQQVEIEEREKWVANFIDEKQNFDFYEYTETEYTAELNNYRTHIYILAKEIL